MSQLTVQQNIQSLIDGWIEAERNGTQFPVSFDLAWPMAGYSTKSNAKRKLLSERLGLSKNIDFAFIRSDEWSQEGRSSDLVALTTDAFKQFCLAAGTPEGKATRLYFIDAEKKWKLTQQRHPAIAQEVEILTLKAEIAKQEAIKAKAEETTMGLRHYCVTVLPKPVADRILGVTEVKDIEYIDRTIAPAGDTYDGIGITYIQKRFGFKSTKQAWDWLESVGYGKLSGHWETQLAAVERQSLPRELLGKLDSMAQQGNRQPYLGEEP